MKELTLPQLRLIAREFAGITCIQFFSLVWSFLLFNLIDTNSDTRAYPDCKLWTFENEQERCSLYNDAEMRVKLHIVVLVIIITIIISQQSSLMLGDCLFGTEIPNQDIKNISCAQYLCSAT